MPLEFSPSELEGGRALLADAADYIEEHGHCKGELEDGQGRVCAIGALSATRREAVRCGAVALQDHSSRQAAQYLIEQTLVGGPSWHIVSWNNHPDRTAQEVIDRFREVAGVYPPEPKPQVKIEAPEHTPNNEKDQVIA